MTTTKRVVRVSQEQISAARAVIRMSGGPDKVTPLIRKIAEAGPPSHGVVDHPAT